MTQFRLLIPQPRVPAWLSCELCERAAPYRRLRLTRVRHDEEPSQGSHDTDPTGLSNDAAKLAMLVLLCADCCALIVGTIDEDEWRRRMAESPARRALPPPA